MPNKTGEEWECNGCGQTEGVENGICPNCGPTQTKPVNDRAKVVAGVDLAQEAKFHKEIENKPEE